MSTERLKAIREKHTYDSKPEVCNNKVKLVFISVMTQRSSFFFASSTVRYELYPSIDFHMS